MRIALNSLSLFLKEKREESGLSQLEVAKQIGYSSPQFVSNWERGIVAPPIETIAILIDLYKIQPNHIIQKIVEDTKDYLDVHLSTPKKRKATIKKQTH